MFSGQIRANIDISLLKIALAALLQMLQTSVYISPNRPEKYLISRWNYRDNVIKFLIKYSHHSIFYQKFYFTVTVRSLKYRMLTFFIQITVIPSKRLANTEYCHTARPSPPCDRNNRKYLDTDKQENQIVTYISTATIVDLDAGSIRRHVSLDQWGDMYLAKRLDKSFISW